MHALCFFITAAGSLLAADPPACLAGKDNARIVETGDFSFAVDSASGAVGDVVPVTISMRSTLPEPEVGFYFFSLALCHDPDVAELVGTPVYSPAFQAVCSAFVAYTPVDEGSDQAGDPVGHGFHAVTGLHDYAGRFPSEDPLPILTVYYRLKGRPGDTGALAFCNDLEVGAERCRPSTIYSDSPAKSPRFTYYVSTANGEGALTVLPGPATHPDRPPSPPEARIYDSLPGIDAAGFTIRIQGATILVGDKDVRADVYVRARVEYAGVTLPIDFDERYLRLTGVEQHLLSGVAVSSTTDAVPGPGVDEGWAVVSAGFGISFLRIAPAGEEVLAATLHFDLLEPATEIDETVVRATRVLRGGATTFAPEIWVRHRGDSGSDPLGVEELVPPLRVIDGRIRIRDPAGRFRRGDANADGRMDVSDAVNTLGSLYLGTEDSPCQDAADANDDGEIDISDVIATLNVLFVDSEPLPPPTETGGVDPTEDALGCDWYPRSKL